MRAGRPSPPVVLTVKERYTLERWARRLRTARAFAQRARIVLACAGGKTNASIAVKAGVTRQTVGRWRRRFVGKRLNGLLDEPRPGAPRKITDAKVERVVRLTLATMPRDARHWSTRAMAKRCRLSQTAVSRIWRAFTLQPHRVAAVRQARQRPRVDALVLGGRQKIEKSVAFSVMNSRRAGVPSRVFSTARVMAGTISPGSVTRSP